MRNEHRTVVFALFIIIPDANLQTRNIVAKSVTAEYSILKFVKVLKFLK